MSALSLLSDEGRARLGRAVARAYFRLGSNRREIARRNLRAAMPGLPEKEVEEIARLCAENFGTVFFDFLAAARLTRKELLERVVPEGLEHYLRAVERGRGVFLLSAHLGNWEIGALAAGLLSRPIASVVRPLDNPYLERDLARQRGIFGNRVIAKKRAAREILREMRDGNTVAILIDQNVLAREAVFVPFFGRLAATSPALALLQKKTGAAVVPVFCRPRGKGRYRLRFEPAVLADELAGPETAVEALTARYTRIVEDAVRAEPSLWLWMHNRWRTRPPGEGA
jgi:KDO2-lipid IV(A) lauroyltransferase